MRGDGQVGEAEYRRGALLGHQVAEGREESPQLRGRFRDVSKQFRALHDLGVRMFTMGLNGPDFDLGPIRDWLDYRDEVNARS